MYKVVVKRSDEATYPQVAPFHPDCAFPERPFVECDNRKNPVYAAVRSCFRLAGLDSTNFGQREWNPLGELINSGETVLLKPNLVKEVHPRDSLGWQYVLTHGSVIRAVADYVYIALKGKGTIIVADAPQTDSSFTRIANLLGLDIIRDFYIEKGVDFRLIDLRGEEWTNEGGVIVARRKLSGDPEGAIAFDLGTASEFANHAGEGNYYGADYNSAEVNYHHSAGRHEYLIAGTAIKSDVIFSLPKLKTHKKAGITASLKNLIGVNADKNWLPHHTEGSPQSHGDEHPSPDLKHKVERKLATAAKRVVISLPVLGSRALKMSRRVGEQVFGDTENVIRSGNWWGNDTIWRTCLDLNKIIAYGESNGRLRADESKNVKRHYVLVDGIIAGEGRGPMNPDPVAAGILLFGTNAAATDAVCAHVMGFDPERIPIVRQAFRCHHYSLADGDWRDIAVVSDYPDWNGPLAAILNTFRFKPHFGWIGHIERDKT